MFLRDFNTIVEVCSLQYVLSVQSTTTLSSMFYTQVQADFCVTESHNSIIVITVSLNSQVLAFVYGSSLKKKERKEMVQLNF